MERFDLFSLPKEQSSESSVNNNYVFSPAVIGLKKGKGLKALTIKKLAVATAVIAVALFAWWLLGPVRGELEREVAIAWEINRKVRLAEEKQMHDLPTALNELAGQNWINEGDLRFLLRHGARYYPLSARGKAIPVRFEMAIADRRVLCFGDGPVFAGLKDDQEGYDSVALTGFIDRNRSEIEDFLLQSGASDERQW